VIEPSPHEGHGSESDIKDIGLSPRDNGVCRWLYIVGAAKSQLGADAEAVAWREPL
jgi:hypothetical protein